jgi:sec-independent protein translocase protein TatA
MGGFSFWHFMFFGAILLLVFGPKRLPELGKALGDSVRNYKKGVKGESDIDVTDSVKRLPKDED